ncbi:MAG: flagellar basal body-associated FliL family protein [Cognatishimia sp.]
MAKAPKNKDQEPETDATADGEEAAKPKSSKKLLLAAVVLSLLSLGGGFFLARMAFQQDAQQYEPDYVEETESAEMAEDAEGGHGDEADHGDEEDADHADEGGAAGEGEEDPGTEGLLAFDEILTNITSYDAHGVPGHSFLKLSVVMIYRPDPGAEALMEKRQPFMRDLFNGYARSLTEADVRGMAGILTVKAELLKRARAAAGNDLPQEILISDLIVQ